MSSFSFILFAIASEAIDSEREELIREALNLPSQGIIVKEITDIGVSGILEVQLADGPVVYVTEDGRHFFLGDMYSISKSGLRNVSELKREKNRVEILSQVDLDDMIIFPPTKNLRAAITVFTDITCFYCQKLHREVPALNARGVEVRYLAYPRAGIGSDGYKKLASAWCAKDRLETLTKLKAGESLPTNVCPGNPVASQFGLGKELDVRGTPAIITEDGKMIPGYRSAEDLISNLDLK